MVGPQGIAQTVVLAWASAARPRSQTAIDARTLDHLRALGDALEIGPVPSTWTRGEGGGAYFDVEDGLGRVSLEIPKGLRPGDDFSALVRLNRIPGISRAGAPPIAREVVLSAYVGRHFCVDVPTGEMEERVVARVCDAPPGGVTSRCEERIRVPMTKRVVHEVRAGAGDVRATLALVRSGNEGPNVARLMWAIWLGGEPVTTTGHRLVDAYMGRSLTSYELAGVGWLASYDDDGR